MERPTTRLRVAPDILSVNFAGITLKNPVIAASCTFGYGAEFEDVVHLSKFGGFVVKEFTRTDGWKSSPVYGKRRPGCLMPSACKISGPGLSQGETAEPAQDENIVVLECFWLQPRRLRADHRNSE